MRGRSAGSTSEPSAQDRRPARDRTALRATVAASAALTAGTVPAFLVGALSAPIGDDLGFGPAATGTAIAVFFVGAGLSAVPMGRLTERFGARMALRTGLAISGGSTLAVALAAHSWWQLALILAVAGTAIGFIDTGAARSFTDVIRTDRHGVAFGVKEASVPAASLLAGLSIPLLTERLGWRSAFVVGCLLAPFVWTLVPASRRPTPRSGSGARGSVDQTSDRPDAGRAPLVVFAVGVAVGTGAATSAATFLVPAFVDAGWSPGAAGALLALASTASIATRLVLGWASDRHPAATWRAVGLAMASGAAGATALTAGDGALAVAGAVLLLGAGWGWTGLAFLAAVRATPDAPALAAGIVLTGLAVGGAGGPMAYGAVSSRWSFAAAWTVTAAALVLGAALTTVARAAQERRH